MAYLSSHISPGSVTPSTFLENQFLVSPGTPYHTELSRHAILLYSPFETPVVNYEKLCGLFAKYLSILAVFSRRVIPSLSSSSSHLANISGIIDARTSLDNN